MLNISKTGRETFTKFSVFWGSSLKYPVQNMEVCLPTFWREGMGESWTYDPTYLQKGRSGEGGLEIFCAVGGLWVLKNTICASRSPVKGGPGKILSVSKNFPETSRQIFTKNLRVLGNMYSISMHNCTCFFFSLLMHSIYYCTFCICICVNFVCHFVCY